MAASQHLSQFGISMEQAHEWVMSHLETPEVIYTVARQYAISSEMLAEIVAPSFPGATARVVESFFDAQGLDGASLGSGTSSGDGKGEGGEPSSLAEDLAKLMALTVENNLNTGLLSTESLRLGVLSTPVSTADASAPGSFITRFVAPEEYDSFFDDANLDLNSDGKLDAEEIGFRGLPESLQSSFDGGSESLYYGTILNILTSIDEEELDAAGMLTESSSEQEIIQFLNTVLEDEADPALFTESELYDFLTLATANAIVVTGDAEYSLFPDIAIII